MTINETVFDWNTLVFADLVSGAFNNFLFRNVHSSWHIHNKFFPFYFRPRPHFRLLPNSTYLNNRQKDRRQPWMISQLPRKARKVPPTWALRVPAAFFFPRVFAHSCSKIFFFIKIHHLSH